MRAAFLRCPVEHVVAPSVEIRPANGRRACLAADDLARDHPRAAGYVHQAADTIEQASAALKERSLDDLTGAVGRFARAQPAAFFAAAVLAGFALSRFVKGAASSSTAHN